MAPLPLRELQSRLRALIVDPAALASSPDALASELAALSIRGDARLSAVERVRVYATMYALRLRDALAHDYLALRRALGDAAFTDLARSYVASHPSDRPSLRDLGRHLPAFARRHPELLEPWQAELAQLEWAMVDAFDGPDQPVLSAAHLEALPPDAWPELRLEPVGSLVLLSCASPVDALRGQLLAGQDVSDVAREPVRLRVWRQEMAVFHRRMDSTEAAALCRIAAGTTFAELCEWLSEHADTENAAAEALRLLGRWIDDGLLVAPQN